MTRLVEFPSLREAHPVLLESLRRVDPRIDLLQIGPGMDPHGDGAVEWWLVCKPEAWTLEDGGVSRFIKGVKMKAQAYSLSPVPPTMLRMADLLIQRVGWLGRFYGEPCHRIHLWLERAQYQWKQERAAADAAMLDLLDETSATEAKQRKLQAHGREKAKDIHPYFLRGRRSVGPSPRPGRKVAHG